MNKRGMEQALSVVIIGVIVMLVLVLAARFLISPEETGTITMQTGNTTTISSGEDGTRMGGEAERFGEGEKISMSGGATTSWACSGTFSCSEADGDSALCSALEGKGCSYDDALDWCEPDTPVKDCSGLTQSTCTQLGLSYGSTGCTWS